MVRLPTSINDVTSNGSTDTAYTAIAAAVKKPASLPALSTSNQFEVLAEDTILPDAEVTGETNPETHS
ncbi:hypothetical protein K3495_g3904 [Podosphaera aphanis]|nr:hypothetical protein K3495_g3904 [Podosphaera aphanis]